MWVIDFLPFISLGEQQGTKIEVGCAQWQHRQKGGSLTCHIHHAGGNSVKGQRQAQTQYFQLTLCNS